MPKVDERFNTDINYELIIDYMKSGTYHCVIFLFDFQT